MKNFIFTVQGGGPFSRFLQCAVIPLSYVDFDNVYLKLKPFAETTEHDWYLPESVEHMKRHRATMALYGISDPYAHILNYVLDQHVDYTYIDQGELPIGNWYSRSNKIEESPNLISYKTVLNKLRIKNSIKSRVWNYCSENNIGPRTLAVHARMTTMVIHTRRDDEVAITWEDYYKAIDSELNSGNYDDVFVASDNVESLLLLENRYPGRIKFYQNMLRYPNIDINNRQEWSWDYDQFFMKPWWEESFVEALTLAQCGAMVCRESNLSNMAVVFSDTIKKVTRVYDFIN
jgi:hypothetical protein